MSIGVSFIVPAFNEAALLGATLEALHQAGRALGEPYEILVVDDASTDLTAELARQHKARVISVYCRHIAGTRNAGARAAAGEMFIFVDADTIVSADVTIAAVEAMRAGAAGGGAALRFDGTIPYFARVLTPVAVWLLRIFRVAPGCFLFCRRAAFFAVGGFDETFFGAEDVVMSNALKRYGRFDILRQPVTTSGRKLRTHSAFEILRLLLRLILLGTDVIKQRQGMELWYGERRKEGEVTGNHLGRGTHRVAERRRSPGGRTGDPILGILRSESLPERPTMSIHPLTSARETDVVAEAKIQLAAAYRLAVLHELDEGIDNHFTVTVPGHDDRYLILPFGRHWSEARASEMIVFDESGTTLEGKGTVELSAQCIHAPIHRICGVRVVLHTHQPWALALNMLKDNHLLPASQTAAFFHGHIAYDDDYSGTADSLAEGERLASVIDGKQILFMKNHGVIVTGDNMAQAYRRLYKLERVCRTQVLALSTGRPIEVLSEDVVAKVQAPPPNDRHPRAERDRLYFEAMMRVLDRELPGYAQ
jgi:ribulose-5-phosphate 4-epimerase/fuculose-1-phosphate aldolase